MLRNLLLAIAFLSFQFPAVAEVIEGTAVAIDGDTIDMGGTRIRLVGIDAPEAAQTCLREGAEWDCGKEATASLVSMINSEPVACITVATDIYGRKVARCRNRVFDFGQEQLRRGMAVASDGAPDGYAEAVTIAQRMKFGIWSSTFQTPSEWRAANSTSEPIPVMQQQEAAPRGSRLSERVYRNNNGCAIKGNRNRRGEWIYHLPGMPYYDRTRAEELFCTERDAQEAGYRRSRAR